MFVEENFTKEYQLLRKRQENNYTGLKYHGKYPLFLHKLQGFVIMIDI